MRSASLCFGLVVVSALLLTIVGCPPMATVITVKPTDPSLELGSSIVLTVTSSDPEDDVFSWESDNIACALVKPDGRVKALQLGTATISAKANHSGVSGATIVTVAAPAEFGDDLPSDEPEAPSAVSESSSEGCRTMISMTGVGAKVRQEGVRLFHDLTLKGAAETGDPGKPKVPFLAYEYVIPGDSATKQAAQFQVTVTKNNVETFDGIVPYPAQSPAWLDELPAVVSEQKQANETPPPDRPAFVIDEAAYATEKPYPGTDYETEMHVMGNLRVLRVRVYPVQYLGSEKKLDVAREMEITVDFQASAELAAPSIVGDYTGTTPLDVVDEMRLPSRFENRDSIRMLGQAELVTQLPDRDFDLIQDEYFQLLILTRPDLYDEARRLAEHRQAEGWRVFLGSLQSGDWEHVLETIEYLYNRNDLEFSGVSLQPLRALVLFGDTEHIETCPGMNYRGWPRPSDPAESVSIVGTDNRYATVEGDDYIPDFAVGRISVDDLAEAEAVVSKIIRYESQIGHVPPHNMATYSYFQEEPTPWLELDGEVAFTVGSTVVTGDGTNFEGAFYPTIYADYVRIQGGYDDYNKWSQVNVVISERRLELVEPFNGPSDVTGTAEIGYLDGRDNWEFVKGAERVRQWMLDRGCLVRFGYTRNRGPVPHRAFDGSPLPDDLLTYFWNCTTADIQSRWRQGIDGIVLHCDHGSRSGWNAPNFRSGDIVSRSSPIMGFDPIVLNMNCSSGWFDNETDMRAWGDGTDRADADTNSECQSEMLLRQPNGGAVAVIAAIRGSDAGRNDKLIDGIFGAFYSDYEEGTMAGRTDHTAAIRLGEAFWAAKMHQMPYMGDATYMQYNMEIYHLFGDPLMQLNLPQPPR